MGWTRMATMVYLSMQADSAPVGILGCSKQQYRQYCLFSLLSEYENNSQRDDETRARKSFEFRHLRPITNHQFVFVPWRIPPPHADYSITIYLTINFTWLRLTSVIIHSDNTYFRYGHKIWCRQGTRHSYNNISSNIDPINTQQL